ncbi:otoferlin-like [Vanessa atalanta]|uniref:otoferlin-like n=1 Tax=Vanessa atalanta TaxID=42275 RepID=UPI001FCDA1AB|nr:otoferlin-like [Vanessa atalanta]
MSLSVNLNRFKILKCKYEKYAQLEFRGHIKYSVVLLDDQELVNVNQKFEWPVSTPVTAGEVLTVTLLMRVRFGSSRKVGVYRLGLDIVAADGQISVIDTLLDDRNQAVPAFVEMDVYYTPPVPAEITHEDETSARIIELPPRQNARAQLPQTPPQRTRPSQPPHLIPSVHISRRSSGQGSSKDSSQIYIPPAVPGTSSQSSAPQSDGDDDNALENLQRNIESLETSIKMKNTIIDIDAGDERESRTRRLKSAGKRILRRGLSMGVNKNETGPPESPNKRSTLKTMKNLMRLGRRYRSAGDEEQGLLEMPGTSTDMDRPTSQTSMSSDDNIFVDTRLPASIPRAKSRRHAMIEDTSEPVALKAADFQVCVTIIEARQLAGLNMDPVVSIQIGEVRKYTSVKESTNCPYYNEYFVFDFHMAPVMLFDKIIILSVLHSRRILRSDKLLGIFKLDVATVWNQPDRQFYHKWALLTDPDDMAAGAKGYLKCDITVIGKGDPIKIPPKSDKDDDDIEANLLLPDGVPLERQRARFIIKVYKADGLPEMNYSIMANVKKAFTGERQDLVDPYVHVSFAGMIGYTSVKKNSYNPLWNEQIVFTEMFPPLCQRIRIQLRDNHPVHPSVIGTHFIDLRTISYDGDGGFLPTFGPSYIYMYGSTRDYTLLDQHSGLNLGMGEGVAYRARVLVSIRTEIIDSFEFPSSNVVIEPIIPIHEASYEKNEQFFLFGCIYDVHMIDKSLVDKPIHFELSIGNAGNTIDGRNQSLRRPQDLDNVDLDELSSDTGYWQSTTVPVKAVACGDKHYYYLPYWDTKQCMQVRSIWPDHRRRMYNSNLIANIIDLFDEGLADASTALHSDEGPDNTCLAGLKSALEAVSVACANYVKHMNNSPPIGNTKLDRERHKLCISEIDQIGVSTRSLKALITKNSLKERLRTAYSYLNRLKHICEDAQQAMPDVFLWMISQGKRLAYQRFSARDLIYSESRDETGRMCGKIQSMFMKWPGKRASLPSGWAVPAKVNVYLWLGVVQDKKHYIDGLPQGFEYNNELKNADKLRSNAPTSIYYIEKHVFQMRAYIYQARSLIGSDSSGLSDPFARVVIEECSATTKVIDETLSPTWDELLVFQDITLYSTMDQIKTEPPTIVVEIFDQDQVGKSEYIGRTIARPHVKAFNELYEKPQFPPSLEWYEITRGDDGAGELLATFELLEIPPKESTLSLPELPPPKEIPENQPLEIRYPVPKGIRPTLSKYRIEVLFWGLRDVKRIHLLTVDRPRVDIECAGHIIYSTVIQNAKRNPNFSSPVKYIDVELPDQDLYRPPLTIRVVDCRSFGRVTLVGTHTINSIHKYIYTPMSKRERDIEERKKSMIQLHNIDLQANCIIQDDVYIVDNDRESCPLLFHDGRVTMPYGSRRPGVAKKVMKFDGGKNRKPSTVSVIDDDDGNKDWWTKYFASVEFLIEEEKENKRERQGNIQTPQLTYVDETRSPRDEVQSPRSERGTNRRSSAPTRAKIIPVLTKKNEIPRSALTRIIPHELEAVPEYEGFKEWLQSFELYRGKKTGDDSEDDTRIVGVFKGAVKVYKWPLPKAIDDCTIMGFDPNHGFFQGVPNNEPIHVLVRVYIVKATDLHPMDLNGKADPYIVLQLGSKKISDKENYVSKQLNPVFGKCFEIEATIPQDSMLTVQVYDWDLLGSDDLIGETKIDLENRFYSRHRATCGLPKKYEEQGYNRWRDAMKPTQILAKLCKDGKIDPPIYEYGRIKVGRTIFNMPLNDTELFSDPDTMEEQMALVVLHRWDEVPRIGTKLVTEHVETRPLYNPSKPGIEQGRLQMWVDMFPMDMPLPGPPLDISPRKPKSYEMRVIIWNTDDVVLEDDAFFTGEKMSDIYVKGWLKGPDDCQSTDIHYRSLTGEGNFNWRFIYPFDYLEAEERIVISRKETVFSWDETECKIPARLELQVWDADHFTTDDFLGAITLDLNRFPRGAKSSKLCTLQMLSNDGSVPMVNIFKQKRVKGWWPFYIKGDTEEMELTGKVEAEIHLLTREEADKVPAGLGRSEPDPLDRPNRPDSSFMWLFNPLKSLRYIMWHNYKWDIVAYGCFILVAILILSFVYAFPGYIVKKFVGA